MAASFPSLLAAGVTDLGRFDPFHLFAGESDIVTDQAQAADNTAILQFQVLTYDSDGRLTPWLGTADYAYGTITFTDSPSDTETVSVNGNAITFIATGTPAADEVLIDADDTVTVSRFAAVINSDPATYAVHASIGATGLVVTVTAIEAGTGGNAIALAEATATAVSVSGATLTDVTGAETVPTGNPVAIAAQAVPSTSTGPMLPIYTGGVFNHEALVWPAGVATLAQRRAALAGTNLGVRQLL
jgi:hypothetical protein